MYRMLSLVDLGSAQLPSHPRSQEALPRRLSTTALQLRRAPLRSPRAGGHGEHRGGGHVRLCTGASPADPHAGRSKNETPHTKRYYNPNGLIHLYILQFFLHRPGRRIRKLQ